MGTTCAILPVDQVRRMITVLFQFPAPYFATAAENIAMGDIDCRQEMGTIEAAARSAGAHGFYRSPAKGL